MLTCLRVRDFAIIDRVEVELGPGLNVVTGETGAGKSILVAALQLVLGGKGRGDVVRTGKKCAEVEALFELSKLGKEGEEEGLRQRLLEAGIDVEEELLICRKVFPGGRTRAYINGRLATAAQLAVVAAGLADISSQHEHHSLIEPRRHLDYLDAFGSLEGEREKVRQHYEALAIATRALNAHDERVSTRADREDLLRFQLREIDELAPQEGEIASLEEERGRLRHATRLMEATGGAEESLYADDGAITEQLGRICDAVRDAATIDGQLEGPAERLDDALAQLEDVAGELGRYARTLHADPNRLGEVESRLALYARLGRKYGATEEELRQHRDNAAAALESFDDAEGKRAELEAAVEAARAKAHKVAKKLSRARKKHARTLGARISEELATLGMGGARVEVALADWDAPRQSPNKTSAALKKAAGHASKAVAKGKAHTEKAGKGTDGTASSTRIEVDGTRLTPTGIDRAEFLIAPNKGEAARPLAKVASGGELSRSLLAIKRVLAGLRPAGLYVFDEVDTGVGGAVAEVIGQKLVEVARHHQVLCITHLPQIAAYGDTHFRVSKHLRGRGKSERTCSQIEKLSAEERLEEVARMVGGVKITSITRATAAEMLSGAGMAVAS